MKKKAKKPARRLFSMKPYEVASVTKGANKKSFCVIKEAPMGSKLNSKALVAAVNQLAQTVNVLKSGAQLDQSAQQALEPKLWEAIHGVVQAAGLSSDDSFNTEIKEIAAGLDQLSLDITSSGANLEFADQISAWAEKAQKLTESLGMDPKAFLNSALGVVPEEASVSQDAKQDETPKNDAPAVQPETAQPEVAVAPGTVAASAQPETAQPEVAVAPEAPAATAPVTEMPAAPPAVQAQAEASEQVVTKADLEAFAKTLVGNVADLVKKEISTVKAATLVPGTQDPDSKGKDGLFSDDDFDEFDLANSKGLAKINLPTF